VRNCAPENLEIPRCAIAQLWFSPHGLPRNDGVYDAVGLGEHHWRPSRAESGWSSISELPAIQPEGRSVLDTSLRGM